MLDKLIKHGTMEAAEYENVNLPRYVHVSNVVWVDARFCRRTHEINHHFLFIFAKRNSNVGCIGRFIE